MNNYTFLSRIPSLLLKRYEDNKFYLMIYLFDCEVFLLVSDKLSKDSSNNGLYRILTNNLLYEGIDDFIIGEDYFISEEYNNGEYPENIYIEHYDYDLIGYYDNLDSLYNKDISNINYFIYKNNQLENQFTEEELLSLNSTFMQLINDLNHFDDILVDNNLVYKYVIDYYRNGQNDNAIIMMNSIFNTNIATTTSTLCGCNQMSGNCSSNSASGTSALNTGTDLVNYDNATCIDKYKAAMFEWLKTMLSDTNFYCDWMNMTSNEYEDKIPNDELIDSLIELLTEFLNLNLNYNGSSSGNCQYHKRTYSTNRYDLKSYIDCGDGLNDLMSNSNCTINDIISNYIHVLEIVKAGEINENKNKIYIWGKQFAEIFPTLNF